MACVSCGNGIWVCEVGSHTPDCMDFEVAQRNWNYQGRHRVPAGQVTVWCRSGTSVVISQTQPLPLPAPKPPWESAGEICFPENADYDVWRQPGEGCELMIAQASNTNEDKSCED